MLIRENQLTKRHLLMINMIQILPKLVYYWLLCVLLSPRGKGLNPDAGFRLKQRITKVIPGRSNAAVRLRIWGEVKGVGFSGWLYRKARANGIAGLAIPWGKSRVEAVLVGPPSKIETVLPVVWKGPERAKVVKVRADWFNKPIKTEKNRLIPEKVKEQQGPWSQETVERLYKTIDYLGSMMEKPNRFNETGVFTTAGEIERAALSRDLFVVRMDKINYLLSPRKEIGLQNALSSRVSTIIRSISNHKHLSKIILSQQGLPVPRGGVFKEIKEAKKYMTSCNFPLVVKPVAGSYGRGITVDVRTEEDLEVAWNYARKYHEQVIVEELIIGVDVRVLVVGGKACAALLRIPANVVGDGKKSVEELIYRKNQQRLANPRLSKSPIIPDAYMEQFLKRRGYSLDSIPKKGEIVFLHLKANLSAGGDSVGITDHIHPDLMRLAEEAASAFGVDDYWGIDLLVERIDLPRDQQRCCVIEVNSRANIFNVQFPMYGKPVDVAEMYINHLFPEDTFEQSYPVENGKIQVSGILDKSFLDFVRQMSKQLKFNGHIRHVGSTVEIIISGRRHRILSFLSQLWDWKDRKGIIVDGLQVSEYSGPVEEGFFVNEDNINDKKQRQKQIVSHFDPGRIGAMNLPPRSDYGQDAEDINTWLFLEEFRRRGYQAQPFSEDLIMISKDGLSGITGLRYSSIFCDEACANIYPAKKLLALHGLPVARGALFRSGRRRREALEYFSYISKPCVVTAISSQGLTAHEVKSIKEFKKVWRETRANGANHILVEEHVKGWHVIIAVVAGQAMGALAVEPVSIRGDGKLNIQQLIENKNRQRMKNPWYQDKLITIDKHLIEQLKSSGYQLDFVPVEGERVLLENGISLDWGGETVNIDPFLNHKFKEMAVKATAVIPGLEFAFVHMLIPAPDLAPAEQRWVIQKIDTKPNVAIFHFPWRGKPCNLVEKVVSDLSLTDRMKWVKVDRKGRILC